MTSKYQNARKYFITTKESLPLHQAISTYLPSVDAERLIQAGGVWKNRQRITSRESTVMEGETLMIYITPDQGRKYVLNPNAIIRETKDWIIIDKPAAVTVVSDRSNTTYNLTFAVGQYLKSQGSMYAPSPITRLDFMVQGLVIYPKNKAAEITLFKAMTSGHIHKTYAAAIPQHDPIAHDKIVQDKIGFKGKTMIDHDGKEAITKFQFLSRNNDIDYYLMTPITGKRHQLRFHAARHLSPIIGDTLYGSQHPHPDETIALMAIQYTFTLNGEQHDVELPDWESRIREVANTPPPRATSAK